MNNKDNMDNQEKRGIKRKRNDPGVPPGFEQIYQVKIVKENNK